MNRVVTGIALALWILGMMAWDSWTGVPPAGATTPPEEAWNQLFNNHYAEAKAGFEAEVAASGSEPSLRGLLLTAWADEDFPEMARIVARLVEAYPESPYLSAYLSLFSLPDLQGWKTQDRLDTLDRALAKNPGPPFRQALQYERMETLDMRAEEQAAEAARQAGVLTDHWQVTGPFGRYGAPDFFTPFGPETGIQDEYPGWQRTVRLTPVDPVDQTGLIELGTLINSRAGVGYALNAVESARAGEAWLTVSSPGVFRVWWNGRPVMEKAHYFLDSARERSVKVPVQAGKNLLVVKSQFSNPAWWFRATLQSAGGEPSWNSIPFQAADFATTFLLPFDAAQPREIEREESRSPYPLTLPEANTPIDQAVQHVLLAAWRQDRKESAAAQDHVRQAAALAPAFSFLYALEGNIALGRAGDRPPSKSRFHREAEAAFQKALELDPHSRAALVGLQSYYLDRDQIDQALDLLNAQVAAYPNLLTEGYPNLLRYAFGILYSRQNFATEAARAYQQSMKDFIPSYEVYRHLFDYHARNHDHRGAAAVIQQALDVFPAYMPFLECAKQVWEALPGEVDLPGILERAARLHPHTLPYHFLTADLLVQQGKLEEARALYATLRERYPNNPGLVEESARLALLASDKSAALADYEQAHRMDPRAMRPFQALRDLGGQNDFPYQKYDQRLEELDLSQVKQWENTRASGVYLLDLMVLDLHEDGSYDQYIHQAIQVFNQEGLEKWAEMVIPNGDNIEIILARTLAPDGLEWDVSNVQNLGQQQSLSLYGLAPGAILEYAYLERAGSGDPGANYHAGGYFFAAEDDSMLLSKLTVIRPANIPFHLDANPKDFAPSITQEGDKTIYVWEKRLSEGIKPESFSPPLAERVPSIQWSTCPDWLTFAERQRASLWGFEEPADDIARLAGEWKQGSASRLDIVKTAYDWIQKNIEETEGGTTTADTMSLRAGQRYQKLRLARQLLRHAGVETRLAYAMENDEHDGFRPMPNLAFPGAPVLIVPRQEGIPERILLDFGSRFLPYNRVPPTLRRMMAFVHDGPVPYFEPLDPSLWDEGLLDRQATLQLRDDRSAVIQGTYRYDNMLDQIVREALTNPEVKQRLVDAQLTTEFQGIRVEKSSLEDLDDLNRPPRLEFSGSLPDIAKPAGDRELKIAPILVRANASALVREPTRAFPLVFESSPVWNTLELRFDMARYLEQGASIPLPDNVLLLTQYGYYSLFYAWEGSQVVVKRTLLIPKQKIQPGVYEGFVRFCRDIDQAEDREIRVTFPPA
ncbi:MAG: DUF3857 domain-containing protein [bacterium]